MTLKTEGVGQPEKKKGIWVEMGGGKLNPRELKKLLMLEGLLPMGCGKDPELVRFYLSLQPTSETMRVFSTSGGKLHEKPVEAPAPPKKDVRPESETVPKA